MVCRKAMVTLTRCYCVIYAWHTYIDDERCVLMLLIIMVVLL